MNFKLKDFLISLLFVAGFLSLYKLLESVVPATGKWAFVFPLGLLIVALAIIVFVSQLLRKGR
jgi:hypothetical protein